MSKPNERIVKTNGISLNVVEQGQGPLVLLCHGFPEISYSWRRQINSLAEAGFHVVAPDMRGYGKSDRPEAIDQYTIFHLAGRTSASGSFPRNRQPQRALPAAQSGASDQPDAANG